MEEAGANEVAGDVRRCDLHGLAYASNASGCVLCRRATAAPAPAPGSRRRLLGTAMIAGPLALVALTSLWWKSDDPPFRLGVSASAADNDDYVACLDTCRANSERCDTACQVGHGAGCRPSCLLVHGECSQECRSMHRMLPDTDPPAYWSRSMPPWDEVLLAMRDPLAEAGKCKGGNSFATLRVDAKAAGGAPQAVVVAARGGDATYESCTMAALEKTALPASSEPYSLVASFELHEDPLERAVRAAGSARNAAEEAGDKLLVGRAQQRSSLLHAKLIERQQKAREEAQRQAEEAAKPQAPEPYYPTYNSYPTYEPSYKVVKTYDSYRPPRAPKNQSSSSDAWQTRHQNDSVQREVDRMREARLSEERWQRQKREAEVRRMDYEAQRRRMYEDLRR